MIQQPIPIGSKILFKWPTADGGWALGEIVAQLRDDDEFNYTAACEDDPAAGHFLSITKYAKSGRSKTNSWVGDARDCLYRSRPGPPFLGVCP
eukprot:6799000-Prymnesium_polylepis.1